MLSFVLAPFRSPLGGKGGKGGRKKEKRRVESYLNLPSIYYHSKRENKGKGKKGRKKEKISLILL